MTWCQGCGFSIHYCQQSGNKCYETSETTNGISSGNGGNGKTDGYFPGSGGGGGHYGGVGGDRANDGSEAYKGMSCSGSSYFNPTYISNSGSEPGQRSGNGLLRITTFIQCMDECAMCNSSYECSSCPSGKFLKLAHCVSSCGDGYFQNNKECTMCNSLCKTCSGNADTCTTCPTNKYLYGTECVSECPEATYQGNGKCEQCLEGCATCSNNVQCDACKQGFYFDDTMKCVDECPSGMYVENGKCNQCSSNCLTCSGSSDNCTSCHDGYHSPINGKCISITQFYSKFKIKKRKFVYLIY